MAFLTIYFFDIRIKQGDIMKKIVNGAIFITIFIWFIGFVMGQQEIEREYFQS